MIDMKFSRIKKWVSLLLHRHGKSAFLYRLPNRARLLDIGCGNDSALIIKKQRPDLYYVGIDIGEYNQTVDPRLHADEFVLTTPENFHLEIAKFKNQMDAVISSHNIEHCDHPEKTMQAMLGALRTNGCIYLSFPTEKSIGFPSRRGTLNFFDDVTHKKVPEFERIRSMIADAGFKIIYCKKRHRPIALFFLGLLNEPISAIRRQVMRGTWALYGFESVIWAIKN